MKNDSAFKELTECELQECNGGFNWFWAFVDGVWKLIDENM